MTPLSEIALFENRLILGAKDAGIRLGPDQIRQLVAHATELISWNKKMNLTAIRDPELIAEKHFIDALAVSRFFTDEVRVMDMGTGGGFPAIPLKVMQPQMEFFLVDAVRKKVTFLSHVIRTLGLDRIRAEHARVEDLAKKEGVAGSFDAVIARGFARLDTYAALALPMVRPGGTIWALKGEGGTQEITPALEAQFHIRTDDYTLPFERAGRVLIRLTPSQPG